MSGDAANMPTTSVGHGACAVEFVAVAAYNETSKRRQAVPEICRFFGIIIRMFFSEHNPPHIHAEFQDAKAVFDLAGNITAGRLKSRTAIKLVREWIDLHADELREDWELAQAGKDLNHIAPLD